MVYDYYLLFSSCFYSKQLFEPRIFQLGDTLTTELQYPAPWTMFNFTMLFKDIECFRTGNIFINCFKRATYLPSTTMTASVLRPSASKRYVPAISSVTLWIFSLWKLPSLEMVKSSDDLI